MESTYTKLALCGGKNECARTDTLFFAISEVSDGTVSLPTHRVVPGCIPGPALPCSPSFLFNRPGVAGAVLQTPL